MGVHYLRARHDNVLPFKVGKLAFTQTPEESQLHDEINAKVIHDLNVKCFLVVFSGF